MKPSGISCNAYILFIAASYLAAVWTINHQYHPPAAHAFIVPQTIISRKPVAPTTTTTVPNIHQHNYHLLQQSRKNRYNVLMMATTAAASDEELEKEIQAMKAKDIRQELESYGISTKSFFEKSELVGALIAARKEGKTPIGNVNGDDGSEGSSSTSSASSSSTSNSSGANRQERLNQEIEKCKSMKVSDLKKELESFGVSTKSYFEKSEFVRAVAEARVDGVKKSSGSSGSSSSSSRSGNKVNEEPRDPSYRDVSVSKFSGGKALLGGRVIDVRAR
ncbi:hypothetical protein ACHAWC_008658 [Mediolabrus comicus]